MDNINDQTAEDDAVAGQLIDAEALRDITLSREELYSIAKTNFCETLMSSMVGVATKNGSSFYAAQLLDQLDETLRDDIISVFDNLGYKTSLSEPIYLQEAKQNVRTLTVSWEKKV